MIEAIKKVEANPELTRVQVTDDNKIAVFQAKFDADTGDRLPEEIITDFMPEDLEDKIKALKDEIALLEGFRDKQLATAISEKAVEVEVIK